MRIGRVEKDDAGHVVDASRYFRNTHNFTVHSDELLELESPGPGLRAAYFYGDGDRGSRVLGKKLGRGD